MRFKKIKQRGQALVLYGLFAPLLFLILGVVMDLGWYYLNVSRLQNAADAAALAGAQALVKKDNTFDNYYLVQLASNQLPADFDKYENVYSNTFKDVEAGTLYNYKKADDVKDTLKEGRNTAEEYVRKNLLDETAINASATYKNILSATDAWSTEEDSAVNGTVELKYKIVDAKNDVYGPLYYVVELQEKIRHFFLPGWFDDMNAPVRAVVLLKPHYKGLLEPMQQLERTQVIDNWEYTNKYKDSSTGLSVSGGKWNHYQAAPGLSGSSNKGIKYTSGNTYRTESVTVRTQDKNKDSTSSGTTTAANGNKFYSESEVDSINIDFRAEVTGKFKSDWDLGYDFPETGHKYQFAEGWSATDGADKRIHFNADFDQSFRTRDPSKEADPLWVRIESDPLKNPYTGAGVSNFNSVRQITLNFNDNNTEKNSQGNYAYRPYVIFYTGPENIDYTTDENGVLIRHSQPAVLNLNEDLNAIVYMPESPVVINGNGHALHGFVIAKCFLFSVTEEDMTNKGTVELYDGFNAPKNFTGDFSTGTDSQNQTVYFHDSDALTYEELTALYDTDATIITDTTTGNITVTDKIDAPRQPVISFTEDLYTNCTTLEGYFVATANYINTTYTKEKYMQFTGLSEDKVSMITFPDETYANGKYNNFTAITIPVATADLLDTDPDPSAAPKDDKYVKVMLGEEVKYIAKAKLPYTRIKRNEKYPYVCIYDLKTGFDKTSETGFAGAKPTDDSITPSSDKNDNSAVVFLNPAATYKDSWAINKDLLEKTYDTNYQADKLMIAEEGGVRYFILKSDINDEQQVVGKYKKITTLDAEGYEVVKYIRDDDNTPYYTKVDNNQKHPENNNYIITDKNGNMLTKPVTAPDIVGKTTEADNLYLIAQTEINGSKTLTDYWNTYTRYPNGTIVKENIANKEAIANATPKEIPEDYVENIVDGNYRGNDEKHWNDDYRIPAFERVYKKSVFNLREDSYYSYFDIDLLNRVNYTYLNVDELEHLANGDQRAEWAIDDMFFTTTRAAWID